MGLVESAQMAQDYYQHIDAKNLAKRNLNMDKRSYHMNMVGSIREDLRDLCSQQYSQIDTIMVVSTLVLSFGFGFVFEGTFPGLEDNTKLFYDVPVLMIPYAVLLGLSVILPFWSIWYALECKNKIDAFLARLLRNEFDKRMNLQCWLEHYTSFERYWNDKCQWHFDAAHNFFWGGMISNMFEVTLLTCMNFRWMYAEPVWITFLVIMLVNMLLATGILTFRGIRSMYRGSGGTGLMMAGWQMKDFEREMNVNLTDRSSGATVMHSYASDQQGKHRTASQQSASIPSYVSNQASSRKIITSANNEMMPLDKNPRRDRESRSPSLEQPTFYDDGMQSYGTPRAMSDSDSDGNEDMGNIW